MAIVNFTDTQLQARFERNLAEVGAADDLCQVRALMRAKPNHPISRELNANISMLAKSRKI